MLSNTATPRYYGAFRDAVIRGEIPVNQLVSMEMNRIDRLIANPSIYYDPGPVEGYIAYCESELCLTNGADMYLLDTFKLWAEQVFSWYYFVERQVPVKNLFSPGVHYETRKVKKRLIKKQYLIVARGGSKSMYNSTLHSYWLNVNPATTHQIATAPTMKQAEETLAPIKTSIILPRGPLFKFLTRGSQSSNSSEYRPKLASTKKGIENLITGSLLEVLPMDIDKLQGYRPALSSVDEWLSGDTREDPIGAIEQGATKEQGGQGDDDYLIVATSSEGTVRNGVGDAIKMELLSILKGEYDDPHTSIWYYRLDNIDEVADPSKWIKAQPNIGHTVSYETYQRDVERAEKNPTVRNDILAKRFGIPMEGYTYFFTYEETLRHTPHDFWGMPCSMGADLSQGDDFCAFTFLFPFRGELFGIKARSYISSDTFDRLDRAMRVKYEEFIAEGTLVVLDGVTLKMDAVYDDLDRYISVKKYEVRSVGYDPYNAKDFIEKWSTDNGEYGVEKVPQGAKTESVPLGELKKLAERRMLIFDESIMQFCMGNSIIIIDTNNNKKLSKKRAAAKIDNVAAMMDAYVAYKLHTDEF